MAAAGRRPLPERVLTVLAFLVFLFAVYGFSNAVTVLKFGMWIRVATKPIPVLGALLRCPACLAFWAGMLVSWQVMSPALPFVDARWKAIFADGLAASGFSYIVHVVMERTSVGLDL